MNYIIKNIVIEKKIVAKVAVQQGLSLSDKEIKKIAKDPDFQSGLCDIIKEV